MINPSKKKSAAKKITLGFAKHLLLKYGPDLLIEAFGVLACKFPFLKLKMAGEGNMCSELKRRVNDIGIEDRVDFWGNIPHSDMPTFLSDVDIAVQPSRLNSESFGVAALEASAMEIAVVSTKVGGVPECVRDGETGILIEPRDVKALTNALSYLIENLDKRKQMGKAGRKFVLGNYRWEKNTEKMMGIYKATLLNFKQR